MTSGTEGSAEWKIHDEEGFLALVGPVLERWDGECLTLGVQAEAKHRNSQGVVQGGMLVTLVDRAMGRATRLALDGAPVATVQLDTHFVSAANLGEFIEAEASVVRMTRSIAFVKGRVTVGDRLVMTAQGIWKRLKEDGAAGQSSQGD